MESITRGEGAPVVLIVPGNDLPARFYVPLAEALARRGASARIARLPGRDGVPALSPPTWDRLVEALVPLAAPVVLGHSMGATLSLLLAARREVEVARLVLMEPAIFVSRALGLLASRRYLRRVVQADRDAFDNEGGGLRRIAAPSRFPPEMLEAYLETRRGADVEYSRALFSAVPKLYPLPFDGVRAPVRILRGAETGRVGAKIVDQLARRLGARRIDIPGAAHFVANEQDLAIAEATLEGLDLAATRLA